MDDLSPDLRKILIMQLKQYLHSVIDNIDDAEKVMNNSLALS